MSKSIVEDICDKHVKQFKEVNCQNYTEHVFKILNINKFKKLLKRMYNHASHIDYETLSNIMGCGNSKNKIC